jgi:hypothetical protein
MLHSMRTQIYYKNYAVIFMHDSVLDLHLNADFLCEKPISLILFLAILLLRNVVPNEGFVYYT